MIRRIAANRIIASDKQFSQYVIEIKDGIVIDCYPLHEELPFTEWLGGTILLEKDKDGNMRASKDGKILK